MTQFATPSSLTHRLRRALRSAALVALTALAIQHLPTAAQAQTNSGPRCAGIIPQPQPNTGLRVLPQKPTTARFVNDSDWDIKITSKGSPDRYINPGNYVDIVTVTGTDWFWETLNDPYRVVRATVERVRTPESQCFVLTKRAPPQPPFNPDPRCAGFAEARDPDTNVRLVNTGDTPITANVHRPDGSLIYNLTVPAGGAQTFTVPLFSDVIWDDRGRNGVLRRLVADRRGAFCALLPNAAGDPSSTTAAPAPSTAQNPTRMPLQNDPPQRSRLALQNDPPQRTRLPQPVPQRQRLALQTAPADPTRTAPQTAPTDRTRLAQPVPQRQRIATQPTPANPTRLAPQTTPNSRTRLATQPAPAAPRRPAVLNAPPKQASPAVAQTPPELPPHDSAHKACTQDDLASLISEGKASGTISLDGECRYVLTRADSDWSGGTGVYIHGVTQINGNGAIIERAPTAPGFRLMGLQATAHTTVENLTLRGGLTTENGGALHAFQRLTLRNVSFEGNTAKGAGGAIAANKEPLVIENSRFIANYATDGGAIQTFADMTITNSLFALNRAASLKGAAILAGAGSSVTVLASTISDNSMNSGAAIYSFSEKLSVHSTLIAWHSIGINIFTEGAAEDYNLFAAVGGGVVTGNGVTVESGGNSMATANPGFVDPEKLNYAISRYSPAADKGRVGLAPATDIAGAPRPFPGSNPDIGAFEAQDLPGPALTIVKTGPFMFQRAQEITFTLTVSNDGTEPAFSVRAEDIFPTGATFVANSVEGIPKGTETMVNGGIGFFLGDLNPGDTRTITYRMVAAQNLVSRNYRVYSEADPEAESRGHPLETPMKTELVTEAQFFPRPDGFAFYNYSDSVDSDITDKDLQWIFGPAACKPDSPKDTCVIRANVEAWRKAQIAGNSRGHCAGMSIASLDIFYNDKLKAADLQPGALNTFQLSKDNARKRIAVYAATQTLTPRNWRDLESSGTRRDPVQREVAPGKTLSNPVEVLDTLIANLKDPNAKDRYRLSFSKPNNGGGGHTVVPFAVEKVASGASDSKGAEKYRILIYENNRPDNFGLSIEIDRNTGEWKYTAQTNPEKELELYEGNGSEDNFGLTSLLWSTAFPMCVPGDSCANAATVSAEDTPQVSVSLSGAGLPLVTRADGKRAGFDPVTGEWISEIPGAQAISVSYGLSANVPPVIQIPHEANQTYSVELAAAPWAPDPQALVSLNVAGPDFMASVGGLILADAASEAGTGRPAMTIGIDTDSRQMTLRSNDGRPQVVTLDLAISQATGADFTLGLQAVQLGGNQIGLGFDAASQSVIVEDDDGAASTYALYVSRLHADGTEDSFRGEVSDGGGPVVALGLGGDWNGSDAPQVVAMPQDRADQPQEQPPSDGSIVLQSMNYADRYLSVAEDGTRVEVVQVTATSDPALLARSRFVFVPLPDIGADIGLLAVNDGSGRYIVATQDAVTLASNSEGNMDGVFRVVPGLAGQGLSFVSLNLPDFYLRHSGFVLRLDQNDESELFQQDATFVPGEAFAQ